MAQSLIMVLIAQVTQIGEVYDKDHLISYVVAFLLIGVFVLIFYNRLYVYRRKEIKALRVSQNARLALILEAGKLRIWLYHPTTRHYAYLSEDGTYGEEYNPVEFAHLYSQEGFESLRQAIFDICDKKRESAIVAISNNASSADEKRYYEMNISVGSRDSKGRVDRVLGIQHDITDKVKKQDYINQLLLRYHTVFNSSLLDMIYCNKEGKPVDINEKACQTFNITNRKEYLATAPSLFDDPHFSSLLKGQSDNIRSSAYFDAESLERNGHVSTKNASSRTYYDSTINQMRDENGQLEGLYMCGMDITDMVESFHRQKESSERVHKATKEVQNYMSNINYALHISGVRFVSYYPKSYTLSVSDNINNPQLRMSQLRCIRLASPRFRRTVSSMLNRMDHLSHYNIVETIETDLHDKNGRPIWLMFNMVPIIDKDGNVERYFGICRDMTDMMETEHRLAIETKKAQETELLKQSFLTNMSYEIRTPLNNVVGFAELFESKHDEADEAFFVEQIKQSSNTLLLLINDILFLSRLDANMIEYTKAYVDFALVFESHCQMGWSGIASNVQTIVENPYEHLVINIDEANLGKVIEKLCGLAGVFTKEGSVSARCEYRRGELTISIQDTGIGIDAKTLPHVFERFIRNQNEELCGTGLDLPIVEALVNQMGGSIDVESELGKGTTLWVSIPCEAKLIEKRKL